LGVEGGADSGELNSIDSRTKGGAMEGAPLSFRDGLPTGRRGWDGRTLTFSARERQGLVRFIGNGGLLFFDDYNHDVNGVYATSFEAEMRRIVPGAEGSRNCPPAIPSITRSSRRCRPVAHEPRTQWMGRQRGARLCAWR